MRLITPLLLLVSVGLASCKSTSESHAPFGAPGAKLARSGDEIMVCGRRDADRYRVPFIVPTPRDPKTRGVPEERALLIAGQSPCKSNGPFLVGCAVGVNVSTKIGGGKIEYRPLAP